MKRQSISSLVSEGEPPPFEDLQLASGKVIRVRRKNYNPNYEDPLWRKFQVQAVTTYLTPASAGRRLRRNRKEPVLLKYDHMDEEVERRNSLIYYNPTVPLPAYYVPPTSKAGEERMVLDDLEYNHHFEAVTEKQPNNNAYPLVILQTHQQPQQPQIQPQMPVSFLEPDPKTSPDAPWCDRRACKIGACIILILLVAVGSFVAYVLYHKYSTA